MHQGQGSSLVELQEGKTTMFVEKPIYQTSIVIGEGRRPADFLIRAREAFLNGVSGASENRVVNNIDSGMEVSPGMDLAKELRKTLDDLKRQFTDEDGLKIDYTELRESTLFADYRRECQSVLRHFDPQSLQTEQARRAFWINIYNALLVDAVISFGIKESVTEGALGLLTFFRRAAYQIGGKRVSLEDIEHGILRGNRGNPFVPGAQFPSDDKRLAWAIPLDTRVHFALNCGSRSCPPVQSYEAERLDEQLDLAARSYVSQDVTALPVQGELRLSRIFRWFQADFGGRPGLVDFLIRHLPNDGRRDFLIATGEDVRLKFKPYDWRLNMA